MSAKKTCPNCNRVLGEVQIVLRVNVSGGCFTKTVCGECFAAEHKELMGMGARLAKETKA